MHFAVDPIVPEDLFDEVLMLLDENRAKGKRKTKPVVHLFSGLTFCECAEKMYVPSNSPKYICKGCRNKIPVADLDHIFKEELRGFVFSAAELDAHRTAGTEEVRTLETLIATLQADHKKAEGEADKLVELYQAGVIDKRGFGTRYEKLGARMKQIGEELPTLQGKRDLLRVALLSQDEVLTESRLLADKWDTLPHEERRHVVETIVSRVIIGTGEVEFEFLYSPPSPSSLPPAGGSGSPTGSGTSGAGSDGIRATQLQGFIAATN